MKNTTRETRPVPDWTRLLIILAAALGPAWTAVAAPKTDVIVLVNGDRLTGEVKGLERGKLSFKTDATGTIQVEWDKVATLHSNQYLQVELTTGLRYAGRAPQHDREGQLLIRLSEDSKGWELPMADVIRIAAIDRGGPIDRLDGYVTAGYDYTKANSLQTLTFSGGLDTRNERRQWSLDGATTQTSQRDVEDTSRFNVDGVYRRFLPERWFWQAFATLDGNDELGLDLRTTVGGAYGRFVSQTPQQEWAAYAGLAVTREDYSEGVEESVEGVVGTQYWFFRYDTPEASLDATLNLFPSLTDSGRVRSEGRLRSRYEIVVDLFFEVSVYGSYDSDPGEGADSKSDYGVTTSLGYSF